MAAEFGKEWVEFALKTTIVEEARRQRDKLNAGLERHWQRIRDARRRKSAIVVADDEVTRAYAAFAAEKDEKRDIPSLADFYLDEFDNLASTFANGIDAEDLDEGREMAALTPDGQRLGRLVNAAQGSTIRNQFSEMKTEMGFPATKVFHSFRHTALTKLHRARVQEATAARIVGHKHPALTFGNYGDKLEVEVLREFLNLIGYKGVAMFE